jgi:hypothetical protein
VAVTVDGVTGRPDPVPTARAWHGIPVFSAWITEPAEPDTTPG